MRVKPRPKTRGSVRVCQARTNKRWLRRGRDLGLAAVVLLMILPVALAFGPYGPGDLPEDELGPHGAMAMAAQEAQLDTLLPERDMTVPPDSVDPVIWEILVPDDNAMTPERVALGRRLYFDTRLSADNTVSCATCHDISRGATDQRPTSEGFNDSLGQRNAPTTLNAFLYETLFLDGRVADLEEQAGFPPINPVEGGHADSDAVMAAISGDAEYQAMFQAAYGSEPNYEDLRRAIGAFQRTLVFLDAPFDRFVRGQQDAISEAARRGWVLFNGRGRCVSCHMLSPSQPLGTDNGFHNIGVAARAQNFEELARQALEALGEGDDAHLLDQLALETDLSELGRFMVTHDRSDIGAFKTQGLRNVGITAPYMHDGSMRTLWDVMDHYNKGGEANPFLDGGIEPLALTEAEIDDLVAFLFTLTDDRFAEQNQAELEAQRQIANEERPFREEDLAMRRVFPFEERIAGQED